MYTFLAVGLTVFMMSEIYAGGYGKKQQFAEYFSNPAQN